MTREQEIQWLKENPGIQPQRRSSWYLKELENDVNLYKDLVDGYRNEIDYLNRTIERQRAKIIKLEEENKS